MPTFVFNVPSKSLQTRYVERTQRRTIRVLTLAHPALAALPQHDPHAHKAAGPLQDIAAFAPRQPVAAPAALLAPAATPAMPSFPLPNEIEEQSEAPHSGRDSPPPPDFGHAADVRLVEVLTASTPPRSRSPSPQRDNKHAIRAQHAQHADPARADENVLHRLARTIGRHIDASSDCAPMATRTLCHGAEAFLRVLSPCCLTETNRNGKNPREVLAERGPEDFMEGARCRAALLALFDTYGKTSRNPASASLTDR